jgi:hypothetical protein
MERCPKCDMPREQESECSRCGLVFSKANREKPEEKTVTTDPPKTWAELKENADRLRAEKDAEKKARLDAMTPEEREAEKRKQTRAMILAGVIGVVIVSGLCWYVGNKSLNWYAPVPKKEQETKPVPTDPCKYRIERAAKNHVRSNLEFSSSADFGWTGSPQAVKVEGTANEYNFAGSVDTKNAMGMKLTYGFIGKGVCRGDDVEIVSFNFHQQ